MITLRWIGLSILLIIHKARDGGAWLLLIIDGYGSHVAIPFHNLATKNKIVLFRLPPHSTHLMQPLDVGDFQHFKHYHTDAIDEAVRLSDQNFGKLEFLAEF